VPPACSTGMQYVTVLLGLVQQCIARKRGSQMNALSLSLNLGQHLTVGNLLPM
jgi:hypothetical protein